MAPFWWLFRIGSLKFRIDFATSVSEAFYEHLGIHLGGFSSSLRKLLGLKTRFGEIKWIFQKA